MKKRSLVIPTIFLQAVIVLIGIGALALMLWEPHIEGRNAHATFFEIYFKDPFLAYAYLASIPFFVALYQVFKVLGYIGPKQGILAGDRESSADYKILCVSHYWFCCGRRTFHYVGQ